MFKSILKMLEHTFPMFCVGLFIMATAALGVAYSAKWILNQ